MNQKLIFLILSLLFFIGFAIYAFEAFLIIFENKKQALKYTLSYLSILGPMMVLINIVFFKSIKKKERIIKEKIVEKKDDDFSEADKELLFFDL